MGLLDKPTGANPFERFRVEGQSGLSDKEIGKLNALGIYVGDLTPTQKLAYQREFAFQRAMKKNGDVTAKKRKSKTAKYINAYWRNVKIQDKLARKCFDEIEAQVEHFYNSIPSSAWEDEEIKSLLLEAIRAIRGI